jgi:uncharacterized protein with von Willebrand factor type A (vWA) domain
MYRWVVVVPQADLARVPLGERLEIARKLRTRRLKALADLLGRMRNARAAGERRSLKSARGQIHDLERSGDLARVLPQERAAAFASHSPRKRRLDFYRRLSERSVPSYSLTTDEPAGRGPIIALIDSSLSMAGEKMEWASALALALAHAAARGARGKGSAGGARRVHALFFNARVVLEVDLEPGERDARKFLSVGTVEAAGGTDWEPPLKRAMELLRTEAYRAADLLLVTDGECELDEGFAAELALAKAEGPSKLVSVLVGEGVAGSLEPFSDRTIAVEALAAAEAKHDAAGAVFGAL